MHIVKYDARVSGSKEGLHARGLVFYILLLHKSSKWRGVSNRWGTDHRLHGMLFTLL
jgi:hypothetical protein